jgi:hypothetical protein
VEDRRPLVRNLLRWVHAALGPIATTLDFLSYAATSYCLAAGSGFFFGQTAPLQSSCNASSSSAMAQCSASAQHSGTMPPMPKCARSQVTKSLSSSKWESAVGPLMPKVGLRR